MTAPTRRYAWLGDPAALDQVLLTKVQDSKGQRWIAECGQRRGCWASAKTPQAALDLLAEMREDYDATFGAVPRSCGCTPDPDTGQHHDQDGWRCSHTTTTSKEF